MSVESALQNKKPVIKSATILRTLAEMAERLGLSSNQAVVLYAGNNFWLNAEMADVAVGILRKLATDRGVDLFDFEEPFIVTLAKRGVFTDGEQRLFGWKVEATTTDDRRPTADGGAAVSSGNGAKNRNSRRPRRAAERGPSGPGTAD